MQNKFSKQIMISPKTLFFIVLIFFFGFSLSAQDLIVTPILDSINARITKENKKSIYFDFMKSGEVRSTFLLRSQVSNYKKGYFDVVEVPKKLKNITNYKGNRIRISTETGFSYRLGKIPKDYDPVVRNYLRGLSSGFQWGASAHYFISEQLAFGAKLITIQSSNSSNDIQTTFLDGSIEQNVSDDLKITFIGPSVLNKSLSSNERNAFITIIGIGYIGYRNSQQLGNRFVEISGGNVGLTAGLGYDIGLSETVSIGISTTSIIGWVNKVKVTYDGATENINLKDNGRKPESLTAYTLSIGLRIYL